MPNPKVIEFPLGTQYNLQYHFKQIEVSSAELLAINGAPKSLVVAPGAGNIIFPINVAAYLHFGTVVYATNISIDIRHTTGTNYLMSLAGLIDKAADRIVGAASQYTPLIINEPLILTEPTGNPTGGDGTLTIYLWYINLEL